MGHDKRIKGTVAWWNDDKGRGHIDGEDENRYYAHFTDIDWSMEYRTLTEGQQVIFLFEDRMHGDLRQASNVRPYPAPPEPQVRPSPKRPSGPPQW